MKKRIPIKKAELLKLSRDILKRGQSIRFQARGWSMRPFIRDGDFLIVSPIEKYSLKIGDVMLFSTVENEVIVHRVIKINKKERGNILLVKGDATLGSPEKVNIKSVLGIVRAIERNGRQKRLDTELYRIIGFFVAGIYPFNQRIYALGRRVRSTGLRIMSPILEKLKNLKL